MKTTRAVPRYDVGLHAPRRRHHDIATIREVQVATEVQEIEVLWCRRIEARRQLGPVWRKQSVVFKDRCLLVVALRNLSPQRQMREQTRLCTRLVDKPELGAREGRIAKPQPGRTKLVRIPPIDRGETADIREPGLTDTSLAHREPVWTGPRLTTKAGAVRICDHDTWAA